MKKKITKIIKAILLLLTVAAIGFACYAQFTVAGENLLTHPTQWGFFLARSYRWFTLGAVVLGVITVVILWVGAVHKRRAARQAIQQTKAVKPRKGRIPSDNVKAAAAAMPIPDLQENTRPKENPLRKEAPNPVETKAAVVPAAQSKLTSNLKEADKKKSASGSFPTIQPEVKKEEPHRREPAKQPVSNRPEVSQEEPPAPIFATKKDSEPISAQNPVQTDTPCAAVPKADSEQPESQSEQNAPVAVQSDVRFCKKCGEPRVPGARFCKRCGYRF